MKLLRNIVSLLLLTAMQLTALAGEGCLFTSEHLTSTTINDITQDKQGYIWIATGYGLNRFDGYRFTTYLYQPDNLHSLSHNNVQTLFVDSDGQLWVGTVKGLNRYNNATDDFEHFDMRPDTDDEPRITNITESPQGSVIVGTSGFGLYEVRKHDTDIRQINQYSANDANDYYWGIFFDQQGRFWKSDNKGVISCFSAGKQPRLLTRHQPETGLTFKFLQTEQGDVLAISKLGGIVFNGSTLAITELHTIQATLNSAIMAPNGNLLLGTTGFGLWRFGLSGQPRELADVSNRNIDFGTASISVVFEDHQHNLWMGCDRRGLLFCPNEQQTFQSWSLANRGFKSSRVIEAMAPASDGGLWAALGDGDLHHFDTKGRITRTIDCPSRLHFVFQDTEGNYWMGAGRTLYSFDERSGRLMSKKTYGGDYLNTMADDGKGTLFLSTFSAGMTVVTPNGTERHYDMYQRDDPRGFLCNNWIFSFLYDSKGLLWVATSSGASCYDPEKDTFKTYGWHNILEGYACLSLAEDGQGHILIGTDRGLFCFDRQKNELRPFPDEKNSLSDKYVGAIVSEKNGDIWCATSMGLWHYSAQDNRMTGYQSGNGLHEREYSMGVCLRLADGRIAFSTSEGPVVFAPISVSSDNHRPGDITLTSMLLGGQPISTQSQSDGRLITTEPIDHSTHFSLSYLDNTFTLEFSNFDFANAHNMALEYRLNDDRWSQTTAGVNAISFNHLRPGTYRLEVRAVENGLYSPVHAYNITIRAPWYCSGVAYLLYALALIMLIGYIAWRYYRNRQQHLAEEKMQFLINATHDIRTPLTLILSPLHKALRESEKLKVSSEKFASTLNDEGTAAANSSLITIHSSLQTIDHNAR